MQITYARPSLVTSAMRPGGSSAVRPTQVRSIEANLACAFAATLVAMRHRMAALLALWLAALTAAPLVASVLAGDGPKMACCKRQMKNCCCRKGGSSKPALAPVPTCAQSCATGRSVGAHEIAFTAPGGETGIAIGQVDASIGFVSYVPSQDGSLTRYQRPPPAYV